MLNHSSNRKYRILLHHDTPALRTRLFQFHRYILSYPELVSTTPPDSHITNPSGPSFRVPKLEAKEGDYLIRLRFSNYFQSHLIEMKASEEPLVYDHGNLAHRGFVDPLFTSSFSITQVFLKDGIPHAEALGVSCVIPVHEFNRYHMFVLRPEDHDLFFYTDKRNVTPSPELFL